MLRVTVPILGTMPRERILERTRGVRSRQKRIGLCGGPLFHLSNDMPWPLGARAVSAAGFCRVGVKVGLQRSSQRKETP